MNIDNMRHFFILSLCAALFIAGCSKNDESVQDPENTVEAWIPIGGSINFNQRALVFSDMKALKSANFGQLQFSQGAKVKGLGSIKSIPASFTEIVAAVPGYGYVVHLNNDSFNGLKESWARLYVVDFTYDEGHATTGVSIKYELNWWPD